MASMNDVFDLSDVRLPKRKSIPAGGQMSMPMGANQGVDFTFQSKDSLPDNIPSNNIPSPQDKTWWDEATSRDPSFQWNPDQHSALSNIGQVISSSYHNFFPELFNLVRGGMSVIGGAGKDVGDIFGMSAGALLNNKRMRDEYVKAFNARNKYALHALNEAGKGFVRDFAHPIDTLTNNPYRLIEDATAALGGAGAGLKGASVLADAAGAARAASAIGRAGRFATKAGDIVGWGIPVKLVSHLAGGVIGFGKRHIFDRAKKWATDRNGVYNHFKDPLASTIAHSMTGAQMRALLSRLNSGELFSSPSQYARYFPDNLVSATKDAVNENEPLQKMNEERVSNASSGVKNIPETNESVHGDYYGKGENWEGDVANKNIQKAFENDLNNLEKTSPNVFLPKEVIDLLYDREFGNTLINNINKNLRLNGVPEIQFDFDNLYPTDVSARKPRVRLTSGEGKPRLRLINETNPNKPDIMSISQRQAQAIMEELEKAPFGVSTGSRATESLVKRLFGNARKAMANSAPDLEALRQKFRTSRLRQSRINVVNEFKNKAFDSAGNVRDSFLKDLKNDSSSFTNPDAFSRNYLLKLIKSTLPKGDSKFLKNPSDLNSLFSEREMKIINDSVRRISDYVRDRNILNKKKPDITNKFDYRNVTTIPNASKIFPNLLNRKVTASKWVLDKLVNGSNSFNANRWIEALSDPAKMRELIERSYRLQKGEDIGSTRFFDPRSEAGQFVQSKIDKKPTKVWKRNLRKGARKVGKGAGKFGAYLWKMRYDPYFAIPARMGKRFLWEHSEFPGSELVRTNLGAQQQKEQDRNNWENYLRTSNSRNSRRSMFSDYSNK